VPAVANLVTALPIPTPSVLAKAERSTFTSAYFESRTIRIGDLGRFWFGSR
jgi:hypothetical protein